MNVFENRNDPKLSNAPMSKESQKAIFEDAKVLGSLQKAVLQHAGDAGLSPIISHSVVPADGNTVQDTMGANARDIDKTPYLYSKPQNWVEKINGGVRKVPFARIRSRIMDITGELARAHGYIKGDFKEEQIVEMMARETTPQTVYIKQKMHKDDLDDIVDFDMAALLKRELQIKEAEERARSILVGDGRQVTDPDHVKTDKIRPIWSDVELYTITATTATLSSLVDDVLGMKAEYRGSGNLTAFMTYADVAKLLTKRDNEGRRLYKNEAELANEMGVRGITTVPSGMGLADTQCIIVDLDDYAIGSWKDAGKKSFFEDFDIDYNQQTYLLESRFCGALVRPKSAICVTITSATL